MKGKSVLWLLLIFRILEIFSILYLPHFLTHYLPLKFSRSTLPLLPLLDRSAVQFGSATPFNLGFSRIEEDHRLNWRFIGLKIKFYWVRLLNWVAIILVLVHERNSRTLTTFNFSDLISFFVCYICHILSLIIYHLSFRAALCRYSLYLIEAQFNLALLLHLIWDFHG